VNHQNTRGFLLYKFSKISIDFKKFQFNNKIHKLGGMGTSPILWRWLLVAGCSFNWEVVVTLKRKSKNDLFFFKVHGFHIPIGN